MASLDELKQAIQKNFLTPLSHLPDAQIRLLDTTHDQSVEDFQKAIAQLFGPTGAFEGQAALDLALLVGDYYAAEQKISDYAINGVSERMSKLISICETALTEIQPLMSSLQDGASWGAAGATFMQDEQQVNEEMPPGVENPIWDIAQLVMVVLAAGVFVWASSDQQTKVSDLWSHLSQWENDMKTLGEQLEPALPHEPTQFAQDVTGDLPSLLTAFTNSLPLTDTQKKLLEDVKSRLGDTPFNETDIEALIRAGYLDPDAIAAMIKGGNLTAYQNANLVKVMNAQTKEKQLDMVALISKGIEVDTVIQLVNNKADLKDIAKNAQILLDGGVKLELINIWLKNKTNLNDAVAIHKQGVDLNQLGTSSQVGDFTNIEGASVNEILSRIPKNAKIEHWTPVPGHSQQGMKFVWQDAAGNKWHVRMHDPDPGAGPGSNSASGWTLRVQRGDEFMDKGGRFHKVGILKPTFKDGKPNPRFNPGAANDTHIPIQNP